MKMYIQRLIWMVCLAAMLAGCSKWLDVQPYDQIGEDELTSSEEGFQKMLNGIYLELNDDALYGKTLTTEMVEIMGGAYEIGDQTLVWQNYPDLKKYNYGTEYWRGRLDQTWDKAYALILNCNKLIAKAEENSGLFTGINYNIIRGEALALRAMLHFDMLRLFGPVYSRNSGAISIPYYTSEVLSPEPLLPASEVVEHLLGDLREARILLNEDPVKTEGTMMSSTVTGSNFLRYRALRLNYYAVTGLLARVCLYAGQKQDASTYAREIIRATNIFPFVDKNLVIGSPDDPDRIFSSEVMFALSHNKRGEIFKNYFDPSRVPNMVFCMESELLEKVIYGGTSGNGDDYRYRANWVAQGGGYYFYKYSDMNETGKIENTMIPLLRLGEMYLIAAESNSDVSYLNTLRKNRGINSTLSSFTTTELQNEYIRELYGEGQLFFMYKRLFSPIIWSYTKSTEPSEAVFVLPLPDSETENR